MIFKQIEFESIIGKLPKLNMPYIEIPIEVVEHFGGKFKVRLLCRVNNNSQFQCGLVALGEGRGYISLNAKRMKEFKVEIGDKVSVGLEIDDSKYGMPVPEELSELLNIDEEGNFRFHSLSPGKQRYIIHYVNQVKNSDLKIQKSIMLIDNLKKTTIGKENFREILGLPPREEKE